MIKMNYCQSYLVKINNTMLSINNNILIPLIGKGGHTGGSSISSEFSAT